MVDSINNGKNKIYKCNITTIIDIFYSKQFLGTHNEKYQARSFRVLVCLYVILITLLKLLTELYMLDHPWPTKGVLI